MDAAAGLLDVVAPGLELVIAAGLDADADVALDTLGAARGVRIVVSLCFVLAALGGVSVGVGVRVGAAGACTGAAGTTGSAPRAPTTAVADGGVSAFSALGE